MLWWTIQKLKSADWQVRAEAARMLAASGQTKAVPALIKALEDEVGDERPAVIEALGAIGHPDAVDALVSVLKNRPPKRDNRRKDPASGTQVAEYKSIAEALARIGSPALSPLTSLLNSEERDTRRWASYALGLIKDARALSPLAERLQDARSEVRQAAARALGDLGDPRAAQPLIKILAGRDPETRRAAAEALGALGAQEAVEPLGLAAQDPNEPLQLAAIEALRRIGGLGAGSRVRQVLETARKAVREAAASALGSMSFETASAEDRATGAVLRGDFEASLREGPAAEAALISALSSRDAGHRLKAVRALGTFRSERVLQPLLGALDDHDRAVQEMAGEALSSIGAPAVSGLIGLLASEHTSVRRLAALALGRIGDLGAVEALVAASVPSRSAPSDDSESLAAASAAADALSGTLAKSAAEISRNMLERIAAMPEQTRAGRLTQPAGSDLERLSATWASVQELARRELRRRSVS